MATSHFVWTDPVGIGTASDGNPTTRESLEVAWPSLPLQRWLLSLFQSPPPMLTGRMVMIPSIRWTGPVGIGTASDGNPHRESLDVT